MIRKYDICYIVTSHKKLQTKFLKLSSNGRILHFFLSVTDKC